MPTTADQLERAHEAVINTAVEMMRVVMATLPAQARCSYAMAIFSSINATSQFMHAAVAGDPAAQDNIAMLVMQAEATWEVVAKELATVLANG